MNKATPDNVKRALQLALEVSVLAKDMEMIKQALDHGADAQKALRVGHRLSDWSIIDLALAAGADINASADGHAVGRTFLIAAVENGDYSAAQEYLNRKADPNLTLGEKTALEIFLERMKESVSRGYAMSEKHKELYKRLVESLPPVVGAAATAPKKEVVLRMPQVAFKDAGGKPAP